MIVIDYNIWSFAINFTIVIKYKLVVLTNNYFYQIEKDGVIAYLF
jgi:hypothetical protein